MDVAKVSDVVSEVMVTVNVFVSVIEDDVDDVVDDVQVSQRAGHRNVTLARVSSSVQKSCVRSLHLLSSGTPLHRLTGPGRLLEVVVVVDWQESHNTGQAV